VSGVEICGGISTRAPLEHYTLPPNTPHPRFEGVVVQEIFHLSFPISHFSLKAKNHLTPQLNPLDDQ
jgi:hypothetical protein